jgi:hypothetical protein
VTLDIAPDGKVARCTVTQSASKALDEKTCAVITERATYPPLRDKDGRLIATTDQARIRWVLPEATAEKFADSWFELSAVVAPDGVSRCTVRGSSEQRNFEQKACDRFVQINATYRPETVSMPYRMTVREEQQVGEGIAPLLKGQGLARVIVRKIVDSEGYVSSCALVPEPNEKVDDGPYYHCLLNGLYEPLPENISNRGDRTLTVTWMRSFTSLSAKER